MRKLFLILSVSIMCVSCSENDAFFPEESDSLYSKNGMKVLQYRNKAYPFETYKSTVATKTRALQDININECLGYSFRLDDYPYESTNNVGFPVLDFTKYIDDNNDAKIYTQGIPIKESNATMTAFSGFSRFEEKSNKSKTVSAGFKISVGIFSIGAKKKYKKVFSLSTEEERQCIFGEMSVCYFDSRYRLKASDSDKRRFKDYVTDAFREDLYHESTQNLFNDYGGFVLADFYSGGQLFSMYKGNYIDSEKKSSETKEKSMEGSLSATYNKMSGSIDASSDKFDGKEEQYTDSFLNISTSFKSFGGIPVFSDFTSPKELNSVNINISEWSKSLQEKQNLTIAKLPDNALLPLSDFVEEDNLQQQIIPQFGIRKSHKKLVI